MLSIWYFCLPGLLTLGSLPGLLVSVGCSDPRLLDNEHQMTVFHRYRRSPSCDDKYKTIPHHTACLEKSSKASDSGVSKEDQKTIVDLHNKYRAEISASNMLKLTWDEEIANIAQKWADNCEIKHDTNEQRSIPGFLSLGQNIANGMSDWETAVNLWQKEKEDFTYGGPNVFLKVGHYTQIVWADTSKIGCGYAKCGTGTYFVCNYGPAGNSNGFDEPYKEGSKCGDCASNCTGDLCDCSKTCLNGGELFRSNCTCKCMKDFYTGGNCALDCGKVEKDPDFCTTGDFGKKGCSVTSSHCPNKCRVCPYAGINYVEGSTPVVQRPGGSGTNVRCDNVMITLVTLSLVLTTL